MALQAARSCDRNGRGERLRSDRKGIKTIFNICYRWLGSRSFLLPFFVLIYILNCFSFLSSPRYAFEPGVQLLCTCYISSYFCTKHLICHRLAIDSQLTPARCFFWQILRPCPCPLRLLANRLPTACQLLGSANDDQIVVCRPHCRSASIARRICSSINFTHFASSCSLRAPISLMCSSRLGLSAKLKKDSKNMVCT